MKTILTLLLHDLKRDGKRPWSMVLLAALPLVLSILIASVFGGSGGSGPMPTLHVAVLDLDKDLLSKLLRSLPTQGDSAQHLQLHFVESQDEGLRLVERRKVSALVILPRGMTKDLLAGRTNSIALFENPAEQILPKIVRQGVSLVALGLSEAADTLGEPLREIRMMIESEDFPIETAVSEVATSSFRRLRGLRAYLFPPLLKFETVQATDFLPLSTNSPAIKPPP